MKVSTRLISACSVADARPPDHRGRMMDDSRVRLTAFILPASISEAKLTLILVCGLPPSARSIFPANSTALSAVMSVGTGDFGTQVIAAPHDGVAVGFGAGVSL